MPEYGWARLHIGRGCRGALGDVASRTVCDAVVVLFLATVAVAVLLAWLYLLCCHGCFWRTDQRLPPGRDPAMWPEVVVIVPARDEADMLPDTLPTLLAQEYPGRCRVVLVDDGSADGTAEVARGLARDAQRDLDIVRGSEPPAGWAGKVWAMAQGLEAAGQAPFVLFTDADIAHGPGTVTALVRAAYGGDRDLVSQMASLRVRAGWERAVIPAFVYFFAQLYPFRWVNRPGGRIAAAAGGCVLVRLSALESAGGLARMRSARIDDVALGRLIKTRPGGGRIWLGFATSVISLRAYPRLRDVWDMVARSAYTQLRNSPLLLAGTVAGLASLYAVPPTATVAGVVLLVAGSTGPAALVATCAGLAGWTVMAVTYMPVLRVYGLAPWRAPMLPFVAILYAGMTVDSARRHRAGHGGMWKGRASPAA